MADSMLWRISVSNEDIHLLHGFKIIGRRAINLGSQIW